MVDGERLAADATVIRFVVPAPSHMTPNGLPTSAAIRPSTEELSRSPVRVSVWNHAFTTLPQAIELTNKPSYVSFALSVGDLDSIGVRLNHSALQVVYEPLSAPRCNEPGAAGHAGIEGLVRPPSMAKRDWDDLRDQLIRAMRRV